MKALRSHGGLDESDEGLVTLARMVADTLDAEYKSPDRSGYTVAVLSGRLQGLLMELRGRRQPIAAPASDDPELDALRTEIRNAARSRAAHDR